MMSDRDKAIDALQELFDFTKLEKEIATAHADQAREVKDFRAMDRHASYANAMQKVHSRVSRIARDGFMYDTSSGQ